MSRIEKDLDQVKRTRSINRKRRNDVPFPAVALVGYTNAGKSTLFNRLTNATVMADDMLFATLDPTLRLLVLPHKGKVILSDTVGFISDLPTMLVSAFRATLEEVLSADVILHVRDISHQDSLAQSADVSAVLHELGIEAEDPRMVEVWNKLDLVGEERRPDLLALALPDEGGERPALVSALTGEGTPALLERIEHKVAAGREVFAIDLEPSDGPSLHWFYENAEVLSRTDRQDGGIALRVRIPAPRTERLKQRFPNAVQLSSSAEGG